MTFPLGEQAVFWVAVDHVTGSAHVSAPTGGGQISATALGPSFGVAWRATNGFYGVGAGSVADFGIDFTSDLRGLLKADVDGYSYSLGAETGWRIELARNASLTPRAWAVRTLVAAERFTDAVNSRVSLPDAVRLFGGLGVAAETAHPLGDGEFSLQASLDVERILSGAETLVRVSGAALRSESPATGILLAVDSVYRWDRYSIGASVNVGAALDSVTYDYSGNVKFGIRL